jgi:hypothetical protein
MGLAVALLQVWHRLNATGLTLFDETGTAQAFATTI